jgi:deoxyhypusine synthase
MSPPPSLCSRLPSSSCTASTLCLCLICLWLLFLDPGGRHSEPRAGSAGGIEEDLIKCLAPTFLGSFDLPGRDLRQRGQNRIGNMLVPNSNYCAFEEFMTGVLDEMLREQEEGSASWTPSRMIRRLGERIDDESSVYYWCALDRSVPLSTLSL